MRRSSMIPLAVFMLESMFLSSSLMAETRRAVVVGINIYRTEEMIVKQRRVLPNLKGTVNDVQAMREILMKRYVYVFGIDSYGNSKLVYPAAAGKGENRYPKTLVNPERKIVLEKAGIKVQPPWGTDTLFMVTTENEIPNPYQVFEFKGARSRSAGNPLMQLIDNYGNARGCRGAKTVPTDRAGRSSD